MGEERPGGRYLQACLGFRVRGLAVKCLFALGFGVIGCYRHFERLQRFLAFMPMYGCAPCLQLKAQTVPQGHRWAADAAGSSSDRKGGRGMTKYPLSNGLGLELASGMVGWLGSCDHPPLLFVERLGS